MVLRSEDCMVRVEIGYTFIRRPLLRKVYYAVFFIVHFDSTRQLQVS